MKSLFSLSSLLSVSLFLSLASFSLGSFSLPPWLGRLPAVDSVSALTPISIAGTQLLDGVTGNRFYSLGLGFDYAIDNLSVNNWKPAIDTLVADSPHINVLRTYIIDTKLEYNLFMDYTASKGIYVIVPLTAGDGCGNLPRGGTPPLGPDTCYPACLLSFGEAIIQQFSQFDNTLAFVVGNEVMNDDATWAAAPCVKAYARDLKSYTSTCGLRKIPLMYTAADNPITGYTAEQTDRLKADYLSCGTEENGIDIFGLNMFRWCGDTCTYQSCGYQQVNDALVGVGVPVLLTEYGCGAFVYGNGVFGIRSFKDTATLYHEMSDVFSGGAAYTYGVRGGYEFSFFNGGSQDPEGFTGLNKTCGYTINGDKCVVDLYEGQLVTASPLIQNQAPASSSPSRLATCPATVLQYDMTLPPTRQGAPGFYFVQCPSGTGMVNTNNSPLPPDTWFGYSSSPTPDPTGAVPTPTITPTPTAAPTPTPTPSPTSTSPTATPTPSPTPSPTATPPTPASSSGLAAAVGGTTGAGTGFDSETGSASGSDNSSIPPKTINGGNTTIAPNPIATGSNSKNGVVAVAPMLGIIVGLVAATVVLGM